MPADAGFVPFPAERAAGYRSAGYWTGQRLDQILQHAAVTWADRVAVIDADAPDANAGYTFAELARLADRAAGELTRLGVAPGDRVLVQLPNSRRFAVALFGLLRAGAIPVLCLPGHRRAELSHLAAVSGAVAILIDDAAAGFDYRAMADRLVAEQPGLQQVILAGQLCASDATPPPAPPVDPGAPALMLVSGGTTGLPKLIARTHDDYRYNATASAALCRLGADDVYLAVLPAAHNFPLACPGLLGAVSVGAATVFLTDPSPEAAFAAIARHGVTVTSLVPALATLWAQACDWEPVTPESLRLLQVGGAKLAADDARRIRATLTPGLQQVFGMAEGLLNFTRLDDPAELIEQTQGAPLCDADELRVVDESGAEVPVGAEGELLVRGPYTLNGYFNDACVNERAFTADGFFRTGDKVRRLADGYLEVTGRVKDVIHRGGESIAAADLEEHLLTHPAIHAVAAVGLPDQYLGEKICAAVVFTGPPVTLAELNRHLDARGAATHTRPDVVVALPALPTTAVGKVDKPAIVRQLSGGAPG